MALAGLWENWRSPAGEWVRSFAIVTTRPNELCAELHNRMPVVLAPQAWPAWLGEESADPRQLKDLLAPFPSEAMTCWPVSPRRQTESYCLAPMNSACLIRTLNSRRSLHLARNSLLFNTLLGLQTSEPPIAPQFASSHAVI